MKKTDLLLGLVVVAGMFVYDRIVEPFLAKQGIL